MPVVVSLASLGVAIVALQQTGQSNKRSFGLTIYDTISNCASDDTFTVTVVNTGQRPVTISGVVFTKPQLGATILPTPVRQTSTPNGPDVRPTTVHLPALLGDGAIVELTYSLVDLIASPESEWPMRIEVTDADGQTQSLYAKRDLEGMVRAARAPQPNVRPGC